MKRKAKPRIKSKPKKRTSKIINRDPFEYFNDDTNFSINHIKKGLPDKEYFKQKMNEENI